MKDIVFNFSDLSYNPKRFISEWSLKYTYALEDYYNKNINTGLDDYESFLNLFRWKNGMTKISEKKLITVNGFWDNVYHLRDLRKEFSWERFEEIFEPSKSSAIWKIFLLHIMDRNEFPIFDQHVFRFFNFYSNGLLEEIPNSNKSKYHLYKNDYLLWFNEIKMDNKLNPKKMDEAFFRVGQLIKTFDGLPYAIEIH